MRSGQTKEKGEKQGMRGKIVTSLIAALALAMALPAMTSNANTISKGTEVNGNYIELSYASDGSNKINEKEVREGDLISDGPIRTYTLSGNYNMKYTSDNGWDTNIRPKVKTMSNSSSDSSSTIYTKVVRTNRDGSDLTDGSSYVNAFVDNNKLYIKVKSDLSDEAKDKLKESPAYFTVVFSTVDITADKTVDFKGIQVNFANRKNSKDFTASQSDLNTDFAQVNFQIGDSYTSGNTEFSNCATPDGVITSAKVTINTDKTVTLKEVSKTDKKNMEDKDLDLSTIIVGGIERNVRDIDDGALKYARMKSVTANYTKTIGESAFQNCKKLKTVVVNGVAVREIEPKAFLNCKKLKVFKVNGKKLNTIGSQAFNNIKKGCKIKIRAEKAKYTKVMNLMKSSGINNVKFQRIDPDDDDDYFDYDDE